MTTEVQKSMTDILRLRFRRVLTFSLGSGAGLAIDLVGFEALVAGGLQPGIANLCSSFASISVVYALVTRYAFGVGTAFRTYVMFIAWYSTSIIAFSIAIASASAATGLPPLACKLASVPLSFALNFAFSRVLFTRR